MNTPRRPTRHNQQSTKTSKDKIVEYLMHAKRDSFHSSSDHLYLSSNLHESDSKYQQTFPFTPTENLTPVCSIISNDINTIMRSSKGDQKSECKSSQYNHNLRSLVTMSKSRNESVSGDSEVDSSNEDEPSSAFNINFLLNPDPNECTISIPDTRNSESSQYPILHTSTTSLKPTINKPPTTEAIESQKLKFVHFANSPNPTIEEKGYHCAVCRRKFQRPSTLRTHMYSHTGEKPFICSFEGCSKRFSVESNMRRHLRLHYTANPRVKNFRKRKTWVHTFTHHFNE